MATEVNLTDKLKYFFGFDKFKGAQEAIIRNVLAGEDTFVLMLPVAVRVFVTNCLRS